MGATVLREPGGGFLTRGEVSGLTGSAAQLSRSLFLWVVLLLLHPNKLYLISSQTSAAFPAQFPFLQSYPGKKKKKVQND